jgi:hypothetical protein
MCLVVLLRLFKFSLHLFHFSLLLCWFTGKIKELVLVCLLLVVLMCIQSIDRTGESTREEENFVLFVPFSLSFGEREREERGEKGLFLFFLVVPHLSISINSYSLNIQTATQKLCSPHILFILYYEKKWTTQIYTKCEGNDTY